MTSLKAEFEKWWFEPLNGNTRRCDLYSNTYDAACAAYSAVAESTTPCSMWDCSGAIVCSNIDCVYKS